MTYSTLNSLCRGGLRLAIVLAVTSSTFAATPAPAPGEHPFIGHMVVTARFMPTSVVAADLGSMTVTAPRQEVVARAADLGSMKVTAPRQDVVARNDGPRAARVSF